MMSRFRRTSRYYRGLSVLSVVTGLIFTLLPTLVFAGSGRLLLAPSSVATQIGKTFSLTLNLTATENVNSASGTVVFPGTLLQAVSVSQTGSIFTNWPQNPTISGETISFAGGLPNPGYSGTGKIFSITFKAKAAGTAGVTVTNGKTLANDGKGTDVYAGTNTAVITIGTPPPTFTAATISSPSHPDQGIWYQKRDLSLTWTKPAKAKSFEYSLSGGKSGTTTETAIIFPGLTDGVWTFQLKTIYPDGQASSSYRAQIDATAPDPFTITVEQPGGKTDPKPTLKYKATDATSGIANYEIFIDGKKVTTTAEEQFTLANQLPGKRSVLIKAFDKAGNSTEAKTEFEVEGFPGPTITSWQHYLSILEPLQLRGTALYDSKIRLYIAGEQIAEFVVKDNLANAQTAKDAKPDQEVEWAFTYKGLIYPGPHSAYAYQVRPNEAVSNRSNEANFFVLPGSITFGGKTFPILLLLLILLILFLIIESLTWYHFHLIIAGIRRRIRNIKDEVDDDLTTLEKQLEKQNHGAHDAVDLTLTAVDRSLDNLSPAPKNSDKKKKKPTS